MSKNRFSKMFATTFSAPHSKGNWTKTKQVLSKLGMALATSEISNKVPGDVS